MIKIDTSWINDYKIEYCSEIIEKMNTKLSKLSDENKKVSPYKYFISKDDDDNDKLDEPFIKKLLTGKLDEISACEKYKSAESEIETLKLELDKNKKKELEKSLNNFFGYDLISKENQGKIRNDIIIKSKVQVCPYCNRQYITPYVNEKDNEKTTADLDHFYAKSKYPLLALSLYNFIPSCNICNSKFKRADDPLFLNPTLYGFGDSAYFKYSSPKNIDSLIGNNQLFNLEIKVTKQTSDTDDYIKRINKNIETFKLNEIYQIHKSFVCELLYKMNAYNNTYSNMLNNALNGLNLSTSEKNTFIYGFDLDPENLGNKPLSKLAYDIVHRNIKSR